jgi:hypothetical protein
MRSLVDMSHVLLLLLLLLLALLQVCAVHEATPHHTDALSG